MWWEENTFPFGKQVKAKATQLCLTLCDPMDYAVHGILQARILEWVAFPFSMGSSQPRDGTEVSCIAGGIFTNWAMTETQNTTPIPKEYKWYDSICGKNNGCIIQTDNLCRSKRNFKKEKDTLEKLYTKNISPGASLVAQLLQNMPAMQKTWVWFLGWKDSPGEGNSYPLQYSGLEN